MIGIILLKRTISIHTRDRIILQKGGHSPKHHCFETKQLVSDLTRIYGISEFQLCLWNNRQDPYISYVGEIVRVG